MKAQEQGERLAREPGLGLAETVAMAEQEEMEEVPAAMRLIVLAVTVVMAAAVDMVQKEGTAVLVETE